jgi:hypothetical protein
MMRQKNEKAQRRGKLPPSVGGHADLFSMVGKPLPTSSEDPGLPLTDVQFVLGHAQLTTTQIYLTQVSGIAIAGRETAGQQVTELPEQCSACLDASPVTWEDQAAVPSDA